LHSFKFFHVIDKAISTKRQKLTIETNESQKDKSLSGLK